MAKVKTLYFEDVTVGDRLPPLRKGPVTHTDLVKYSGASGDFNPIHTVPEFATQSARLPGLIGHGMLSMAYAGQLLTDWIGPDGMVQRLKAQFRAMTFLGDEVLCEGTVSNTRRTKDGNCVDVDITLTAGPDRRQTILGNATVLLPTRKKARAPKRKPAAGKGKAATAARRGTKSKHAA